MQSVYINSVKEKQKGEVKTSQHITDTWCGASLSHDPPLSELCLHTQQPHRFQQANLPSTVPDFPIHYR